jgi:hypothetical protein
MQHQLLDTVGELVDQDAGAWVGRVPDSPNVCDHHDLVDVGRPKEDGRLGVQDLGDMVLPQPVPLAGLVVEGEMAGTVGAGQGDVERHLLLCWRPRLLHRLEHDASLSLPPQTRRLLRAASPNDDSLNRCPLALELALGVLIELLASSFAG